MKFAVIRFPGSNCDQDCVYALNNLEGASADYVWHKDASLAGFNAVVVPGGFSYGDYLRCGAIARFSPIMTAVKDFAAAGGLVIGICNGFQILCESGLLPGALVRNRDLHFLCEHLKVRVEHGGFRHYGDNGFHPPRISFLRASDKRIMNFFARSSLGCPK